MSGHSVALRPGGTPSNQADDLEHHTSLCSNLETRLFEVRCAGQGIGGVKGWGLDCTPENRGKAAWWSKCPILPKSLLLAFRCIRFVYIQIDCGIGQC